MNGRNLQELWTKRAKRFSDMFRARPRSASGWGLGDQITLIAATARQDKPNVQIREIVQKIIEGERSIVLLRSAESGMVDPQHNQNVIDIEGAEYRTVVYSKISFALLNRHVSRILGIPQSAGDLLNAIAASDITTAPLVLWITEAYDFQTDRSKSELLGEGLRKARLCFAPSEPLRAEIQKKYGIKVWMIPLSNLSGDTDLEWISSPELLKELTEWVWNSLEAGAPIDDRFEQLFRRVRDRLTPYVDPPAPADIHWEMQPHFQALCRLRACGHKPDFVIDVGASTGYWSHIATKIFPSSHYFLVEPLLEMYLETEPAIYRLHPEFTKIKAAAGNTAGELELNVSPDLYGSSFFDSGASSGPPVSVRVRTLDEIAVSEGIQGRGLLKIDVQFSEHLVLEGGKEFLKRVDVIFLETSLRRFVPGCKTFGEIVRQLDGLGFQYRDYAGTWRDPATGELLQQDAIFARQGFS